MFFNVQIIAHKMINIKTSLAKSHLSNKMYNQMEKITNNSLLPLHHSHSANLKYNMINTDHSHLLFLQMNKINMIMKMKMNTKTFNKNNPTKIINYKMAIDCLDLANNQIKKITF